jgi:hypothetical protein
MTSDSFIGLVRAVRRAGARPPTSGARAARAACDIIGSARAVGAARRCTGRERETVRRAALVDLTRVARAALGIPADITLTRPGLNVPDDLGQLELVAYGLVVEIAAVMTGEPDDRTAQARRDLEIGSLLCDLVGLAASPALEETR